MEYRSIFLNALEVAPLPYIPAITFCHQTPHHHQKTATCSILFVVLVIGFRAGSTPHMDVPWFPATGRFWEMPFGGYHGVFWCQLVSFGDRDCHYD